MAATSADRKPSMTLPPWDPNLLSGQVAIVTGGSSGIGRATALRMADAGATSVIIADVTEDPRDSGSPTHQLLRDRGVDAHFVQCDITSVADLQNVIDTAEDLGGVSILACAAGIGRAEDVLAVNEAEFGQMMDINVKGTFFAAQAAARSMIAGGRSGAIVTLSSVGGVIGSASMPTYNISKGGVRMMTYSLAASLGPQGIRVNAVHPGVIKTAMTTEDSTLAFDADASQGPLRRIGTPDEVADVLVFLASPLARYVTGSSFFVDGGSHSTKPGREFNSSQA